MQNLGDKVDACTPPLHWVIVQIFLIDFALLSVNIKFNMKALSGANENFRRYDAFFFPLFPL